MMRSQLFTATLTSAIIAAVVAIGSAQQPQFPSEPPKPGEPRDFRVPEARRFTLDNGLQVALVPWGGMPKVRVTLTIRSGNAFEKSGEVWLADLTGDLIREGTTTRSATEISTEAARMGGALTISVGSDTTAIGGDVMSEFGPQFAALVADVTQNPKFPEAELPRLKTNLSRNLAVATQETTGVGCEADRNARPNTNAGLQMPMWTVDPSLMASLGMGSE